MKYLTVLILIIIIFVSLSSLTYGQTGIPQGGGGTNVTGSPAGGGGTNVVGRPEGGGIFTNPLKDGIDSLPGLLKLILDIMVQIGTTVIIIMIIYAGFLYTTARGNQSQLDKAHRVIRGVLIGSAIILGAFVIAQVIKDTADDLMEGVMIEQNIV